MFYIIPSPIGNLDDFTYRSVKVIPTLDYLLCEDTRKTTVLLKHYFPNDYQNIKLLPYHQYNEISKNGKIIELLNQGYNIGLISNAGTPIICDPGFKLIRSLRCQNINICSLPGASVVPAALAACGLPVDRYLFLGYLPKNGPKCEKLFNDIKLSNFNLGTIIFFESPYRLKNSLEIIQNVFGEIYIVIAKEISKIYENYIFGKTTDVINQVGDKIKGEITVLLSLTNEIKP